MSRRARLRALVALALGVLAAGCGTPPRPEDQAPVAHEGSIAEGIDCANCHTPDGWRIGGGTGDGTGFDHAATGFPLTGRHEAVGCVDCHRPRQLVRRDCVSCHADPHQGRLGAQCDACHSARGFELTRAIEIHARTMLPLTGMHVLADCTECHQRRGERTWSNVPADCYACHEDDYRDPALHPSHVGTATSAPFPRECGQCHSPMAWLPAFIDPAIVPSAAPLSAPAQHDLAFAISFGPHRGASCESCHMAPSVPRIVRCTGCHEHGPARIQADHPNLGVATDGPGCLSCHPGGMGR